MPSRHHDERPFYCSGIVGARPVKGMSTHGVIVIPPLVWMVNRGRAWYERDAGRTVPVRVGR